MGTRLNLQTLFENILGSSNVYFQPPSGLSLQYPCIVFDRSDIHSNSADNIPYKHVNEYTVTVIDADPDSEIPDKISRLPQSRFSRYFASDNLNHNVFTLLY